jgi:hypothetical protein
MSLDKLRNSAPKPRTPARSDDEGSNALGEVAGTVAGGVLDRFVTLIAVALIGAASVFLSVAWTYGPQVWLRAAQYRAFTARTDAPIVESWVALDIDVARIISSSHWRASALASPCVVVEYGGDWGAPIRRGFCGNRLGFNESYTLADLREMAPGAAFAWMRDERGFVVPEIRIEAAAREWLATHPVDTFMHAAWPAKTALDWLRIELDRPVDAAIIGWSAATPILALAYAPDRPAASLPAGIVESRMAQRVSWLAIAVGGGIGLVLWFTAMAMLPWLWNFPKPVSYVLAALPLFALPWWGEEFPRALRYFNVELANVIGDMFGDVDRTGRIMASDPASLAQAAGVRLTWRAGDGVYADTFGRFRYATPTPQPESADTALAALTNAVATQARALDDRDRTALFAHLARDKRNDLKAAGIAFLPAAKEALMDSQSSAASRQAARDFLIEWVTSPVETSDKRDPGYAGRLRLWAQLTDIPVPEIASLARSKAGSSTGQ